MTIQSIVPTLGFRPSSRALRRLQASTALVAALAPGLAFAGPDGGKVIAGDAIITQNGAVTNITQNSARTVIEWNTFDTAAGEATRFAQPDANSVAINRITGELPSNIRGELTANGNIWVINRNGITFHDTARVNVGGLVATTSDIDTAKFMAGSNTFDIAGKPDAAVVNKGSITFAEAGLAALVGARASNEGQIIGRLGAAVVAGRQTFAVDVSGGDGILALETSAGTAAAVSASNSGTIDVGGGYVVISAEETVAALESLVSVGGSITADKVAISGRDAAVSGVITAAGGTVDVRGDAVSVASGAVIDVSGADGGGTIAIGGGLRGEGRRAKTVRMAEGATLKSDGLGNASGGLITLWSTDFTGFAGDITARGGDFGGDGGFVEVSSAGDMTVTGSVVTLAPLGDTGTLLIDPNTIVIAIGGGDPAASIDNNGGGTLTIDPAAIVALGNGTDLILEANNDINVNDAVNAPNTVNISLRAGRDIFLNASLETAGTLTLSADHDFSALSLAAPGSNPSANGTGSIIVATAANAITGGAGLFMTVGADAGEFLSISSSTTFTSGGALALPTTDITGAATVATFAANGAITQTGAITADTDAGTALSFTSATAGVTLDNASNALAAVSATAATASEIESTVSMALGASDFTGGVTLTVSGANDLTQTGILIADALILQIGRNIVLNGFDNEIGSVVGGAGTGDASFRFRNSDTAFGVAAAGQTISIDSDSDITTAATDADVIAAVLDITTTGSVTLTDANNRVASLTGDIGGALTVVNDADLSLGLTGSGPTSIDITTTAGTGTGALAQSAAISSALTLNLAGAATLNDPTNSFTSLTADTGAASSFATVGPLALGDSAFTGATDITVSGAGNALTDTGEISAGTLNLNVDGDVTLDTATNAVAEVTGTVTGALTLVNDADLSLGLTGTAPTSIDITTTARSGTGALAQTTAISSALTLDLAGAATLDEATNSFGALTATTGAASSFETTASLALGTSDFTGATAIAVTDTGADLTQTGVVTAASLDLTVDDTVDLSTQSNVISAITGSSGGSADFTNAADLDFSFDATGNAITLDTGTFAVTGTGGAVAADSLALTGTGAGSVSLTDAANAVGTLTGTVGAALDFVTTGALDLGVSAGSMTVHAGGAITNTAGNVTTTTGGAGLFAFTENGAGDINDDQLFDITLTGANSFAGAVSASGDTVDIEATGALAITDLYALTAATIESDAAVTLARVAVGAEAGASGATLTIDAPRDLLVIGTSVSATDIQADNVTFGGAGSTFGAAATFAGGTVAIDRFDVGALALGSASDTVIVNGVSAGGLPAITSGSLTLGGVDLGVGAITLALPGETLTLNGIFADSLSVSAAEVRLGFIQTVATLDVAATGSILSIADANLTVPGDITIAAPEFIAIHGPDITDGAVTFTAPSNLIEVGTDASFDAANEIFLVSTPNGVGFDNDFVGTVTITDSTTGGNLVAAISTAGDLHLAGVGDAVTGLANAAFAAGGLIDQSGAVFVNGTLTAIATGDVTLDDGANQMNIVAVRAVNATVADADAVTVTGVLDDDLSVTAGTVATVNNMAAVNVGMNAGAGVLSNSDLSGDATLTLSGGAGASALTAALVGGTVTVTGATDLSVATSTFGALDASATGTIDLATSLLGATVRVDAATVSTANVSATDMDILASGAVDLGPLAITNALIVQSTTGSIIARDSGSGAAFTPGAVTGGGVVPVTFGIDTSTSIGNAADGRVEFTTGGITRPGTTPVASGVGLSVGQDALFIASTLSAGGALNNFSQTQSVFLAPGGDNLTFDLNRVTLRVNGSATLVDNSGGFAFDLRSGGWTTQSGDILPETGGSIFEGAAADVFGTLTVTTTGAGGNVTDAPDDTAGATAGEVDGIFVQNDANFILSGDLILDGLDGAAPHYILGVIDATANAVTFTSDIGVTLNNITADSLDIRSGSGITDLPAGTLTIAGTSSFVALNDQGTADFSDDVYSNVTLDNGTHLFGGDVSAAGLAVTITSGQDLSVADVYGSASVFLSTVGDLTMTRVAAGAQTGVTPGDTTFDITPATVTAQSDDSITATDIIASTFTLRDRASSGNLNGDASVSNFAVTTLDFGIPLGSLTLSSGTFVGGLVAEADGDVTITNLDIGANNASIVSSAGTATVNGLTANSASVIGNNVSLGFLDIAGALTVNSIGAIDMLTDAVLNESIPDGTSVTVAAPNQPRSFPSTDVGASDVINDVLLARTAATRLIRAGGLTTLNAISRIALAGTTAGSGFENDFATVAITDFNGPGAALAASLEDANGIVFSGVTASTLSVRAGAAAAETGDITQTGAMTLGGAAAFIIDDNGSGGRGSVTLENGGNDFNDVGVIADRAALRDSDGFSVTAGALDGTLVIASGQTGAIDISDVVASAIDATTTGAITTARTETVGATDLSAGANLTVADMVAGAASTLRAGATLSVARFAANDLAIGAGAGATLNGGAAGAITAASSDVAGGLTLRNLRAASIDVTAAGGIATDAVRTAGDMTLFATSGDITLGRTAASAFFVAETANGAISTDQAASFAGSTTTVAAAAAVAIGTDISGVTGSGADGRVTLTTGAGAGASIASPAIAEALFVGTDAFVLGFGNVNLNTSTGGALVDINGSVAFLATGTTNSIEVAGDLAFAETFPGGISPGGAGFVGGLALFSSGTLLARSNTAGNVGTGSAITQSGRAIVSGTSRFITGNDTDGVLGAVTLTDTANQFVGAVSMTTNDGQITGSYGLNIDGVTSSADGGSGGFTATTTTGLAMTAANIAAAGAVTLSSGATMTLSTVTAGTTLTATAAQGITATDVTATAGELALTSTSGQVVGLGLTSGGALSADAGTLVDLTDVAADGVVALTAGTTMTLSNIDAGTGTLTANSTNDMSADTLSADGAIALTSSAGLMSASNVTGGAAITATGDSIGLYTVTAATSLTANAQQGITGSDLTATAGGVTLTSTLAGINVVTLVSGGAVTTDAGTLVDLTDVTADGAVALTADTAVTLANVAAGTGAIDVTVAGALIASTISADGDISLVSTGGSVNASAVTGGAGLTMDAATTLTANTVTANGVTALASGGAMSLASIAAGTGTLDATAGGDLDVLAMTADGVITLTSSGGPVGIDTLSGGAGLTASAATSLYATGVTSVGAAFDAGTTLALTNVAAGTGALDATATGDITVATVTADDAITIDSAAGSIGATAVTTGAALSMDAATLISATDTTSDGASFTSGGQITLTNVAAGTGALTANADNTLTGTTLDADGDITLTSDFGSMNVDGATTRAALSMTALSDVTAINSSAGTTASFTARYSVVALADVAAGATLDAVSAYGVTASRVESGGAMGLSAANGAVAMTDVAAGASLNAVSAYGVTATNVQSAGAMGLSAANGAVAMTGVEAATTLAATAGDQVTASNVNVGGDATLTGGIGASSLSAVAAGGALSASVGGSLVATDVQASDALSLVAGDGFLTATRVVTDGDIVLAAGGLLTAERVEADGDMQLDADGGDLLIASITAGGTLAAESRFGAIRTFATTATTNLFGPTDVADAPGGVSSGLGAVATQSLGAATRQIDVTGGAAFRGGTDVLLARAGGLDNVFNARFAAEAGNNLLVHQMDDATVGIGGAAPAFASGALIADGITSGDHARIEAQGNIFSTATDAVYDIGGDLTIAAGLNGGTVTADIQNLLNVGTLEVMAEGGTVTIGATGSDIGVIALADDITIVAENDVTLGSVIAKKLSVESASSGAGDHLIQNGALAAMRVGATFTGSNNSAVVDLSGASASAYALTAPAAAAMSAQPAVAVTETLSLRQTGAGVTAISLIANDNLFPATVAVNVAGAVSMTEERADLSADAQTYVASLGAGDGGLLQFTEFVTGGNVSILGVDQLQFMTDIGFASGASVEMRTALPPGSPVGTLAANIIFRGDVGTDGLGDPASLLVETGGDVFFFGTVGLGGPGDVFQPLGAVTLTGNNIVVGAAPKLIDTFPFTGLLLQTDLDVFVDNLGEIGVPALPGGPTPGNLGEVVYLIDQGTDTFDYFFANTLDVNSDGGSILFVINRPDAGGQFERDLEFFGVNIIDSITYGGDPERLEMYGFVNDDRARTAGLSVNGEAGTSYFFNGCLVRQTSSCTNLGIAVTVPPLPPIDVPVFELATLDLNELFGAIGNEDLWRLPPAYLGDEDEEEDKNKEAN